MRWLSRFIRRQSLESGLDKELRFHFDKLVEELIAEGVAPGEARRRAVLEFGGLAQLKEECRDARGTRLVEDLLHDLRYAARGLRHNPGSALVAVVSLALGIGANTAVFNVVDAVLLKSLPVRNPEQLRIVTWVRDRLEPKNHSGYSMLDEKGRSVDGSFSWPTYLAFRDHIPQFADVVAFAPGRFTVNAAGTSDDAVGHYVSGNYFVGLGASALAGRVIAPYDDAPGKAGVVVLTHQYWNRRFGLDPAVVGRVISVNNMRVTVIGVIPPAFQGLSPGPAIDIMLPMSMVNASTSTNTYSLDDHDYWWVQIFARLKPGVAEAAAAEATRAVLARQIETYHEMNGVPQIVLEPGTRGVGLLRSSLQDTLYVLAGVIVIVLLIACVNMANLLLARSAARAREVAIRASIGASRGRLVRQMMTESLLLAGAGGLAGLAIAEPMRRLLLMVAAGNRPSLGLEARLDLRALEFTLAVSVATGVFFGLLPALRASRPDVAAA